MSCINTFLFFFILFHYIVRFVLYKASLRFFPSYCPSLEQVHFSSPKLPTVCEPRQACCSPGTGSPLSGGKVSACKVDHLPASSAKVKKMWSCTSILLICFADVHRDFTVYSYTITNIIIIIISVYVFLTLTEVLRAFSSVVRQMPR